MGKIDHAGCVFERLATYPLKLGPRDPQVEALDFPPMVPIFLGLVDRREWIPPTQDRFAQAVIAKLSPSVLRGNQSLLSAVLGRAYRTYISLAVQYHAFAALSDRYRLVIWDGLVDMRQHIDLIAFDDWGVPVGLALRCPTASSEEHATRKDAQTGAIPIMVCRLVVPERDYMAGDYWLYRPEVLIDAVESNAREYRRRWNDEMMRGLKG